MCINLDVCTDTWLTSKPNAGLANAVTGTALREAGAVIAAAGVIQALERNCKRILEGEWT